MAALPQVQHVMRDAEQVNMAFTIVVANINWPIDDVRWRAEFRADPDDIDIALTCDSLENVAQALIRIEKADEATKVVTFSIVGPSHLLQGKAGAYASELVAIRPGIPRDVALMTLAVSPSNTKPGFA